MFWHFEILKKPSKNRFEITMSNFQINIDTVYKVHGHQTNFGSATRRQSCTCKQKRNAAVKQAAEPRVLCQFYLPFMVDHRSQPITKHPYYLS
jgi:hypothetical protein